MQSVNPYSIEKLPHTVFIDADPTGTAPAYAVLLTTDTDPTGDWADGEYSGAWDSTDEKVAAFTPTVGATGADFVLAEGSLYNCWIKVTEGGQTIVEIFDQIRCEVD